MGKSATPFAGKKRGQLMRVFLAASAVGTLYCVVVAVSRSATRSRHDEDHKPPSVAAERTAKRKWAGALPRGGKTVSFYFNGTAPTVPAFWAPTELSHVEHGDPRVTLCRLDLDSYWRNPSKTPMFRDLTSASRCGRSSMSGSLNELYDEAMRTGKPPLRPSAFVFHESRVGSTLIANMLGSIPTNLVYSESAPPPVILNHCRGCSAARKVELLRKLFALMGNSPFHARLFYKFQSITVPQMAPLLAAFPETPWIFVYREPVQVVMSHFKRGGRSAPCVREHRRPRRETADILHMDVSAASRVSPETYCAAHLAMLCEKAIAEDARSGDKALLVNYDSLPGALVHYVIPKHFRLSPLSPDDNKRMLDVANVYSKRRKALPSSSSSSSSSWAGDSAQKEAAASPAIKQAADTIMRPRYDRLLAATNAKTHGDDLLHFKDLKVEDALR